MFESDGFGGIYDNTCGSRASIPDNISNDDDNHDKKNNDNNENNSKQWVWWYALH